MEEDIMRLEKEINDLRVKGEQIKLQEPVDMDKIKAYVRYYLEHLEELILHHCNPVLKARYFGLIFDVAPSYADIVSGTPDISKIKGVNEIFSSAKLFDETHGWARRSGTFSVFVQVNSIFLRYTLSKWILYILLPATKKKCLLLKLYALSLI